MPTHLMTRFTPKEVRTVTLAEPFDFTKSAPVLRYDAPPNVMRAPMHDFRGFGDIGAVLFDLAEDPWRELPLRDEAIESRMKARIAAVLEAHEAPVELITRYGVGSRPDAHPIKRG